MKPRFTVVVLNDYCHVNGGASRIAVDEAVSLADAGHEVIFLGANGPICQELLNSSVRVICLDQSELLNVRYHPSVMLQALWNLPAGRAMRQILAGCNRSSTIVHLHGYTKSLTTSPVHQAIRGGYRVICTLHDFYAACPNGAFFDFPANRLCVRRGLSMSCIVTNCDKRHYSHKLYRVLRSAIQSNLGRFPLRVNSYIALSRKSVALLRPYLPAGAQLFPLENLIEVERLPPVDVAHNRHVVAIGRLDQEKGVALLLDAITRSAVSLTFIGDGPLRSQAEKVPGVHITGWISSAEVKAELRKARCLVFPSLWYETYGLVVSEAAACGVPAIVSDVTAAVERVTDFIDGWHFQSGDPNDLARCLDYTKDDDKVRAAGRAAYERFWANPPVRDNHLSGLEAIYTSVLARSESKPQTGP